MDFPELSIPLSRLTRSREELLTHFFEIRLPASRSQVLEHEGRHAIAGGNAAGFVLVGFVPAARYAKLVASRDFFFLASNQDVSFRRPG